jgi:hypothetical protein
MCSTAVEVEAVEAVEVGSGYQISLLTYVSMSVIGMIITPKGIITRTLSALMTERSKQGLRFSCSKAAQYAAMIT